MASIKAKLTQKAFPFNFEELAGTVLAPNYLEQNLRVGAEQEALEVPQAFFMQNVLPTQRGFDSVHYARVVGQHTYPTYLDKVFTLRDGAGNVALYSHAGGQNLVYTASTGTWVAFPTVSGQVTVAYLKGTTYIAIAGMGLYVYDFGAETFTQQTLSGISFTNVDGVAAANQYLLLWTPDTLAWSDPADPLDFSTSLAGSTGILANRGLLVQCLPISDGLIAYTTHNAVSCLYTGNSTLPFAFREIPNSAGIADPEHVAYEGTANAHIAWTTSGFMQVGMREATLIWPELSAAVAAGVYSSCPVSGTGRYPTLESVDSLAVKLSNIGARYIAVSVKSADAGTIEYPLAYVYDVALDRWGRLDIPHVDMFEYRAPEFMADLSYGGLRATAYSSLMASSYSQLQSAVGGKVPQFGTTFGCVQKLGAVYIGLAAGSAQLDYMETAQAVSGAAEPLLLFGRYRLQRPGAVIFQGLQLSTLPAPSATASVVAHDAAGSVIGELVPTALGRGLGGYVGRLTGAHISLRVTGRMSLTSLEFTLTDGGTNYFPMSSSTAAGEEPLPSNGVVVDGVQVTVEDEYVIS